MCFPKFLHRMAAECLMITLLIGNTRAKLNQVGESYAILNNSVFHIAFIALYETGILPGITFKL